MIYARDEVDRLLRQRSSCSCRVARYFTVASQSRVSADHLIEVHTLRKVRYLLVNINYFKVLRGGNCVGGKGLCQTLSYDLTIEKNRLLLSDEPTTTPIFSFLNLYLGKTDAAI